MKLTYLSVDALPSGVASSQVVPYVEQVASKGVEVELHSFEFGTRDENIDARLRAAGIEWVTHPFGRLGAAGGLGRIARAAWHVRDARLIHARSDIPAAAASLGPDRPWLWDIRAFFAEEGGDWPVLPADTGRIALEYGVTGVPETYVVHPSGMVVGRVEGATAASLNAIIDAQGGLEAATGGVQ